LHDKISRTGVWNSAILHWAEAVRGNLALWDASFAAILDLYAIQNEPELMLHDGYYSMLRIRAGKCSRCGCIKRKGVGISMDDQHHYILDCPVCGPYEAWEGSFPRIKASLPKQVEAGSSVGLRISLTGEWPKTDILPEDSQF